MVEEAVVARKLHPGMGQAVAERTVLRKKENGEFEAWGDVASRVAMGNAMLHPEDYESEYRILRKHIAKATTLMSGRHLQHGDAKQPERPMEVFTNCATAASSFSLFYLLLNGSGVGRSYDDDMMVVNWDYAPNVRCVLSEDHPDFDYMAHESSRLAKHKYTSADALWYEVPDSREGWAKAIELWENSTFEKRHAEKTLVLDFSKVRPKGSPIGGMQSRPASGPVDFMNAINKCMTIKGAGLPRFMQALYIDHYLAECVLSGGARRAARISTKFWKDRSCLKFIEIKRPIEYEGMTLEEVQAFRKERTDRGLPQILPFLWSSNNSVTVDAEFWRYVNADVNSLPKDERADARHAKRVLERLLLCSYGDGTGEPGLINVNTLVNDTKGVEKYVDGLFIQSDRFTINDDTQLMLRKIAKQLIKKKYPFIVNPCGEITLLMLNGFCVIADVVPFHADTLEEAEEAFRATTRALIRTNTMKSVYKREVERTNRIGVGMTGVHEFAWKFFGVGFRDLVNPTKGSKAQEFWDTLKRFSDAVYDEAVSYSKKLGVNVPHTVTTIKPAGTTSKLFGLSEGWHLPAMAWYMRWVQYRHDDPLVSEYRSRGYPVKVLKEYINTVVVGFPTAPIITEIGMGDQLVTAHEATPEEQYKWLQLGEKYWINGSHKRGNQISYTLKYDPKVVSFDEYAKLFVENQGRIKCCSVLPIEEQSAYEYLPEEPVTKAEYENIIKELTGNMVEDIAREHVDCDGGACPIDFNEGEK